MTAVNTSEKLKWLQQLSLEDRKAVLAVIEKCGCICHVAHAMHCFACCEFTYVKVFDPETGT